MFIISDDPSKNGARHLAWIFILFKNTEFVDVNL